MAHTQSLPKVALDTIAEQVDKLYPSLSSDVNTRQQPADLQVGKLYPSLSSDVNTLQQPADLAETFAIWFLPADAIATGNGNLLDLAQNTERWHSQVRIGGEPKVVARSMASENPSDWSVRQVLEGELAKEVDEAIEWVDANVEGDPLVHILDIPAFYITALWLINDAESEVVIANIPESSQALGRLELYDSRYFLDALRQEPAVIGFLA